VVFTQLAPPLEVTLLILAQDEQLPHAVQFTVPAYVARPATTAAFVLHAAGKAMVARIALHDAKLVKLATVMVLFVFLSPVHQPKNAAVEPIKKSKMSKIIKFFNEMSGFSIEILLELTLIYILRS
jgi:hypothetical protein